MSDFPIDGSIWNLLNSGTMGAGSASNSQFSGFSSQAPMTPEQLNLQKVQSVEKSDENEVDLMKRARGIYQAENKNSSFNHEKAWAVLRKPAKWDAPDPAPVDLTEDENVHNEHVFAVNTDKLFGADPRPRPHGKQRPSKKKPNPTHQRAPGKVTRRLNSVSLRLTSFVSNGKPSKRRLRQRKIETGRLRVCKNCDFSPLA
nr:hypothetical protein [Tanacetum cinerariifolium]